MAMDYRSRIYEKYSSSVQGQAKQIDLVAADRWGRSYDTYLRGWLPTDNQSAMLEVGCGYGRLLRFFSKRGYTNVTGLDVSPEQVELARKIHPNVVQGNALELLKKYTGEFDLIIAIDLIEHFYKDEVMHFLDGCHQALRPGGRLIIQTPNADSPFSLVYRYGDFAHEVCFNPRSLSCLMGLSGFTTIEVRETGPVPCGFLSSVRWVLWKLIRLLLLAYNLIETGTCGSGVLTRVFIVSGIRT